jgi:hypothetical protein
MGQPESLAPKGPRERHRSGLFLDLVRVKSQCHRFYMQVRGMEIQGIDQSVAITHVMQEG